MKILMSAYNCSPHGGSEHATGWRWAHGMRDRGHQVHILTSHLNDSVDELERAGLTVFAPRHRFPSALSKGDFGVYGKYVTWQYSGLNLGHELDRKNDYDLVHHVSWGSLFWGTPLWRLGKPTVLGPLGGGQTADAAFSSYFGSQWAQERFRSMLIHEVLPRLPITRTALRRCAVVVANSTTASVIEKAGGKSACLLPDTSVPDARASKFPDRPVPTEATMLWVGRAMPRKGLSLAIEVFAKILTAVPEAKLVVAGKGETLEACRDLADGLGVGSAIDWRGWIDQDELMQLYRSARVFLFSSLRDSLGSQVFEAMHNGLPVVALDQAGVHDFVPANAGALVPITSAEEATRGLARGCIQLLTSDEAWIHASKAASAAAGQYTESSALDAMEQIYADVVATRRG